ncbi:AzlD domain-containing protein [Streptomyces achromogenes]|jgi:branched-subunit amino acid transport protein|uniref:AzlD domain-containing protein n=1 Tax=Streptomyces achromogenes TaxID=67255 RepID=A0ABZ1KE51_STRAH|nr:AzlD domain-containing protein [Streptomyces achromogenes]MCZ0209694.1 AzlD domain-containing protein [Streptomyces sp. UMAF16]
MTLTLLIIGMALCAFATRWVPLVLFGDRELPEVVKSALNYVPGAVLAALVFPAVLSPMWAGGDSEWAVPTLAGGVATLVAGRFVKHFLVVTVIGVVVFFLVKHFFG